MAHSTLTVGRRLRQLREARRLTQSGVARAAGIRPTYLSRLEHDHDAHPSAELLAALATILGGDVDELCALAGRVPPDIYTYLTRSPGAIIAVRQAMRSHAHLVA